MFNRRKVGIGVVVSKAGTGRWGRKSCVGKAPGEHTWGMGRATHREVLHMSVVGTCGSCGGVYKQQEPEPRTKNPESCPECQ